MLLAFVLPLALAALLWFLRRSLALLSFGLALLSFGLALRSLVRSLRFWPLLLVWRRRLLGLLALTLYGRAALLGRRLAGRSLLRIPSPLLRLYALGR